MIVAAAIAWRRESWSLNDLDVALRLCTYIAACAVVAARLAEHRIVLWVLAGMALQGWLSLAPVVARLMWRARGAGLRDRARGGWELASVATAGLAIVTADLKIVFLAVLFWVIAIGVYLLITGLIVGRAVRDSSAPELVQPDIWILMGGAAIATLAGDHIHKAGLQSVWPVTVVTWCRCDGVDPAADLGDAATLPQATELDRGCGGRRCSHSGCIRRLRMPRLSRRVGGG